MARNLRNLFLRWHNNSTILTETHLRNVPLRSQIRFSSSNKSPTQRIIKRSVYVSQSNCIYTNLALEDWFFKNMDFAHHEILLLWQNSPCIVIGRHQNPWVEANISQLKKYGIKLARRNSGGGTVYHDGGNLNLTFFTSKKYYDRRYNLTVIANMLMKELNIQAEITKKDDIVYRGKKLSGTAAKLARDNAYHHCTLLVNVNTEVLKTLLTPEDLGIITNATKSNPSPICNLADENSNVNVSNLMTAMGQQWLSSRLPSKNYEDVSFIEDGFKLVNPTTEWFPGVEKIREDLAKWEWTFGKSPKFEVCRHIPVLSKTNDVTGESRFITVTIKVVEGKIDDVRLKFNGAVEGAPDDVQILTDLRGQPFDESIVHALENLLTDSSYRDTLKQF